MRHGVIYNSMAHFLIILWVVRSCLPYVLIPIAFERWGAQATVAVLSEAFAWSQNGALFFVSLRRCGCI